MKERLAAALAAVRQPVLQETEQSRSFAQVLVEKGAFTPLTPEWLRRLRDAHAEAGPKVDGARAIKARQLADKLGLQIGVHPEESARPRS